MGRPDGKLVKNIPYFERIIPYVMDRRNDSTQYCKVEFELTNLHRYLKGLRAKGHETGIMEAVITSFVFLLQKYPQMNRFVVNKRIYQRSHVCVSFVMLKRGGDKLEETSVKVYAEPGDGLLEISKKIRDIIKENEHIQSKNAVDGLVDRLMTFPLIPGFLVGLLKWSDKHGLLPRRIIDLSPFHSSLFIANLASIHMDYCYHHLYDFGTTGIFITMGMPRRVSGRGGNTKRVMTLGVSIDERISTGATWARALFEFKRLLENPELLHRVDHAEPGPASG